MEQAEAHLAEQVAGAENTSTETGTGNNASSGADSEARKDSVPQVNLTKDSPAPTSITNAGLATSPNQGTKRTHEEAANNINEDIDDYIDDYSIVTDRCQVVRNKINRLIESGEMKVGDFCSAINVSSNAYYNFMHKHGTMKGDECAAYPAAFAFFKRREDMGIKVPTKKQKQAKDAEKDGKDGKGGEETDSVPVYDTCDDIRRQITAYLKKPGVTQAQFGRDLLAQYNTDKAPKGISASQIQSFRGKKGPDSGNTSSVFYSAYVFFEKMRIKQGKPKSQKRKEMKEVWGLDGFDTENANKGLY
ncbi:unnamed protein product [Aureobasidium uvarum]|uniref:DUF7726 domain-containing protein n=1 Tax=Aureobasidium uvarum TaxID=2773716 RepID=A0A9N8PVF7_9PEZI|nr:unnamed protein product [Aureobasidium uvarum]